MSLPLCWQCRNVVVITTAIVSAKMRQRFQVGDFFFVWLQSDKAKWIRQMGYGSTQYELVMASHVILCNYTKMLGVKTSNDQKHRCCLCMLFLYMKVVIYPDSTLLEKPFKPDLLYNTVVHFYIDKKGFSKDKANAIAQAVVKKETERRICKNETCKHFAHDHIRNAEICLVNDCECTKYVK